MCCSGHRSTVRGTGRKAPRGAAFLPRLRLGSHLATKSSVCSPRLFWHPAPSTTFVPWDLELCPDSMWQQEPCVHISSVWRCEWWCWRDLCCVSRSDLLPSLPGIPLCAAFWTTTYRVQYPLLVILSLFDVCIEDVFSHPLGDEAYFFFCSCQNDVLFRSFQSEKSSGAGNDPGWIPH